MAHHTNAGHDLDTSRHRRIRATIAETDGRDSIVKSRGACACGATSCLTLNITGSSQNGGSRPESSRTGFHPSQGLRLAPRAQLSPRRGLASLSDRPFHSAARAPRSWGATVAGRETVVKGLMLRSNALARTRNTQPSGPQHLPRPMEMRAIWKPCGVMLIDCLQAVVVNEKPAEKLSPRILRLKPLPVIRPVTPPEAE